MVVLPLLTEEMLSRHRFKAGFTTWHEEMDRSFASSTKCSSDLLCASQGEKGGSVPQTDGGEGASVVRGDPGEGKRSSPAENAAPSGDCIPALLLPVFLLLVTVLSFDQGGEGESAPGARPNAVEGMLLNERWGAVVSKEVCRRLPPSAALRLSVTAAILASFMAGTRGATAPSAVWLSFSVL